MGLGQYNSLGEYCGPHTASSVFLILVHYILHWDHRKPSNFIEHFIKDCLLAFMCISVSTWFCVIDSDIENNSVFKFKTL